eukprot:2274190-Rhodomonas_salina.2
MPRALSTRAFSSQVLGPSSTSLRTFSDISGFAIRGAALTESGVCGTKPTLPLTNVRYGHRKCGTDQAYAMSGMVWFTDQAYAAATRCPVLRDIRYGHRVYGTAQPVLSFVPRADSFDRVLLDPPCSAL